MRATGERASGRRRHVPVDSPPLHYKDNASERRDIEKRVTFDRHQVRLHPGGEASDPVAEAKRLRNTQPDPPSLVEGAMETASIVVLRQRPRSLPGKERRGQLPVPEQASLFVFS